MIEELSKSDNWFSSDNRKCRKCFWDTV